MRFDEVFFLEIEDVELVHARMIADYGGADGLRDAGLLESVVMAPRSVVGPAGRTRVPNLGPKPSLPRSEKRTDEGIEFLELLPEPERRSQLPGVIPERLDIALPARAQVCFEDAPASNAVRSVMTAPGNTRQAARVGVGRGPREPRSRSSCR
jgi:hypothetical protein